MTTYLTWVPEDISPTRANDTSLPEHVRHLRTIEARRPSDAAAKAALFVEVHDHPFEVEVMVMRATDLRRKEWRRRKYAVKFSRTVEKVEVNPTLDEARFKVPAGMK